MLKRNKEQSEDLELTEALLPRDVAGMYALQGHDGGYIYANVDVGGKEEVLPTEALRPQANVEMLIITTGDESRSDRLGHRTHRCIMTETDGSLIGYTVKEQPVTLHGVGDESREPDYNVIAVSHEMSDLFQGANRGSVRLKNPVVTNVLRNTPEDPNIDVAVEGAELGAKDRAATMLGSRMREVQSAISRYEADNTQSAA